MEKIRRFRDKKNIDNNISDENYRYFQKVKELKRLRHELMKQHYKHHEKHFKEFKRIHMCLRWLRPASILLSVFLLFLVFKFVGMKAITIFLVVVFTLKEIAHIYITMTMEKRIMVPIEKLKDSAREIAKGNYDIRIDNNVYNEIGVLIDDFNEMAETLKQSERMKYEYEENRKELIANISHDLKTPITSINGYIEALVDGVVTSPEKVNNYLKVIHNNSVYINNLIDDLFLFSKLDMQKLEFNFEEVKIKPFMTDLMEEFDFVLKEKKITFKFQDDLLQELEVNIDGKRIYQVIRNVIGNAVKYGNKDDSIIEVRLWNRDKYINIEVKDNGPGIPEDKLPNIFDRFYCIDSARTKDFMSTGLGLAIAKEMVEAHGGKIHATSVLGEGTTFIIQLPIKKGENI